MRVCFVFVLFFGRSRLATQTDGSSATETSLPAVGLPIGGESRGKLWEKAKLTLRHVYGNYLDDYDWFFKADDDT